MSVGNELLDVRIVLGDAIGQQLRAVELDVVRLLLLARLLSFDGWRT